MDSFVGALGDILSKLDPVVSLLVLVAIGSSSMLFVTLKSFAERGPNKDLAARLGEIERTQKLLEETRKNASGHIDRLEERVRELQGTITMMATKQTVCFQNILKIVSQLERLYPDADFQPIRDEVMRYMDPPATVPQ